MLVLDLFGLNGYGSVVDIGGIVSGVPVRQIITFSLDLGIRH